MWCNRCEQDVPGVADDEQAQEMRCARCGEPHTGLPPLENQSHESDGGNTEEVGAPFDDLTDPWTDEFDSTEGLLAAFSARFPEEPAAETPFPSPHFSGAAFSESQQSRSSQANRQLRYDTPFSAAAEHATRRSRPLHGGGASWLMILLSVATFVCGGVLLAWSFVANRPDLWQYGLPLTLAGQAGLFVGVLLQLEGLSQTSREATRTLNELDEQLYDLRHATTLLSRTHSGASQSFYAHLSEGASPHLLLTDLKGQLDLLATQMDKQRHRPGG